MGRKMKDSGIPWIGEIPGHYTMIRNKYLLDYEKGKNPQNINTEKIGIPYVGASDLDRLTHEYINYTTDKLNKCKTEDVLILWDGARAGLIGRGHNGIISSTITNVKPNSNYIDINFWYWYLKGFQNYLYSCIYGTTIPHMNRKYIEDISFINWPLHEQQKIAAYLDSKVSQIDSIIEKQTQLIQEYKAYKQSIITETVTKGLNPDVPMKDSGIEWIGEIPEHWEVSKVKYFMRVKSGESISRDSFDENGKYKVIGSNGEIGRTNKFNLSQEKLIIGRVGAVGSLNIFKDCWINENALIVENEESLNTKFLYYLLSNIDFLSFSTGTAQPLMTGTQLKNTNTTIPPIAEQKQIAGYLDEKCKYIDDLITEKQKLIDELETYKKSLIYECVTGKKEIPDTY